MNLIYKCNSCEHEWEDLLEKCPKCEHEKHTVIEKVEEGSSWLKYSVLILGIVGLCYGLYKLTIPPPPQKTCELSVVSTSENSFTYDCNCDDVVFKSLGTGRILYQENGQVFPCESDDVSWEVSSHENKVFKGQVQFTLISRPHKYACEEECELISFEANSITCEYTAVVTKGCEEYVQISFDGENWGKEGNVKFNKEIIGSSNEIFARFSNENSGAVDKMSIASCNIPVLVRCADSQMIKEAFNSWMNDLNIPLQNNKFLELVSCNGSEPVLKYAGRDNHINDFLFDVDPSMDVFDLKRLEVENVVYNSNNTQILEIKLNQ